MIREATLDDVPQIVAMGLAFREESSYATEVCENSEQIATTSKFLIGSENGVIFVAEKDETLVGMIGMLLFTHHFSGERVAGELVWWAHRDHRGIGLSLLRRAETWARAMGAQRIQMIAPNDEVGFISARIYDRFGYQPLETAYQKTL